MKIAQVSPLFESVPPRTYGGTERVVSYLTEALVDAGHDVTRWRHTCCCWIMCCVMRTATTSSISIPTTCIFRWRGP